MQKAILHIGSNSGDRDVNLKLAIEEILTNIGSISKISSVYETEAWGKTDQKDFLNQALEINTPLDAYELLTECMKIEDKLGRLRMVKWGPRTIDIDIIFFDEEEIDSENLVIPHPRMHERNFVLFPLYEIIPDWKHPILKKSISQLLETSIDSLAIFQRN